MISILNCGSLARRRDLAASSTRQHGARASKTGARRGRTLARNPGHHSGPDEWARAAARGVTHHTGSGPRQTTGLPAQKNETGIFGRLTQPKPPAASDGCPLAAPYQRPVHREMRPPDDHHANPVHEGDQPTPPRRSCAAAGPTRARRRTSPARCPRSGDARTNCRMIGRMRWWTTSSATTSSAARQEPHMHRHVVEKRHVTPLPHARPSTTDSTSNGSHATRSDDKQCVAKHFQRVPADASDAEWYSGPPGPRESTVPSKVILRRGSWSSWMPPVAGYRRHTGRLGPVGCRGRDRGHGQQEYRQEERQRARHHMITPAMDESSRAGCPTAGERPHRAGKSRGRRT